MTTTLPTVLISGASEELTARIEHLVRGQAELSLLKTVTPEEAVNAVFKAKLIWIELESDPEGNVALLDHLIKSHPNTFFVVSKEDLEPDLVKRTMQVGALDFLDHKGWAAQIRSVVRRIMAKEFGAKPSSGSPMSGSARQPQRPSTWGALNSLKVTVPPNSGFKRVEPAKATAQPTAPMAPPAPPNPAPQVVPEPEPVEIQEEQPYEETEQAPAGDFESEVGYAEGETPAGDFEAEVGYAEGEAGYAEGEVAAGDYAEGGYAEGEAAADDYEGGYAESEAGYAEGEGEVPAGDYETEGGYAEGEAGYGEGEAPAGDYEGGYAEGEAAYGEGEVPAGDYEGGYAEAEVESGELPGDDGAAESEPLAEDIEPEQAAEEPAETAASEPEIETAPPETVAAEQQKQSSSKTPAQSAGQKGRWDDLDSIISTTKPEEKKAPSKWGELSNIQTAKAKEPSTSQSSLPSSKWSDLDAIGTKPSAPPEAPAAKAASKWSDLDAIASKGGAAPASSAGSKWGDLDALSSKISEPASPSANKWGDLDAIGGKTAGSEAAPQSSPGNKWGDLDAIGGGGAKTSETEPTAGGAMKWGDLDAIAAPNQPAADAGKWGNLDALGGKTGAPKTNAKSFIKPKGQDVTTTSAKAKWGDLAADPGAAAPEPAAPGSKWGNLDSIGSGMTKVQPMDSPATTDGGPKWGDLNAIPTPKTNQDPAGNWGDLTAIPTPATPEVVLVEGSLPSSQVSNEASQKWKAGMSSDISTGARQVGEMRDKLKEKSKKVVTVKLGWQGVSIALAVAIVASAGFLSYQFFTYPTPPVDSTHK